MPTFVSLLVNVLQLLLIIDGTHDETSMVNLPVLCQGVTDIKPF